MNRRGTQPPNHAHITGGLPTSDELAKMGETVTFDVQLHTAGRGPGDPKKMGHENVGPDRSGNHYHLRVEHYYVQRVPQHGP